MNLLEKYFQNFWLSFFFATGLKNFKVSEISEISKNKVLQKFLAIQYLFPLLIQLEEYFSQPSLL